VELNTGGIVVYIYFMQLFISFKKNVTKPDEMNIMKTFVWE